MTVEYKRMQQLRGTSAQWITDNIVPLDGEVALERAAEGLRLKVGDGVTPYAALPYVIPVLYSAGGFWTTPPPTASEVMLRHVVAEPVAFEANWAGSTGRIATNPTATMVLDIAKNGAAAGTMTISTGGVFTFAGAAVTFVAGDELTITAPATPDASAAQASFTLTGLRV